MYRSYHIYLKLLLLITTAVSCSKKDYLDTKPDQSLTVPSTIQDYQALLDNDQLNGAGGSAASGLVPGLGELGSDN